MDEFDNLLSWFNFFINCMRTDEEEEDTSG